jgi:hypothetical protein
MFRRSRRVVAVDSFTDQTLPGETIAGNGSSDLE